MKANYCDLQCEACRRGAPPASAEDVEIFLKNNPGWEVTEISGIRTLSKAYPFDDFVSALAFTNRIGELAEAEGHHPQIITDWGRVRVNWWTHKIHNIHENDLIMAAKTDRLCANLENERENVAGDILGVGFRRQ